MLEYNSLGVQDLSVAGILAAHLAGAGSSKSGRFFLIHCLQSQEDSSLFFLENYRNLNKRTVTRP